MFLSHPKGPTAYRSVFLGLGKKLKNFNLNESALTGVFFNFVIFKKIPNPFVGKTTKFVEK